MDSSNDIKIGDKVSVIEESVSAVVTKILADKTLDLTFTDGEQGYYSAAEVEKLWTAAKYDGTHSTHTSGPWKVLGEPAVDFRHDNPFSASRFIATSDAQWEQDGNGELEAGSLICAMRDGPAANAQLIAAAPDLLTQLIAMTDAYADAMRDAGVTHYPEALHVVQTARAAIARATNPNA